MPTTHNISPAALANARAVVVISADSRFHPAIVGGAWATMKAARGQTFHPDRLLPAHLVEAAPAPDQAAALADAQADIIADITARAMARVRRRAAILAGLPGEGSVA